MTKSLFTSKTFWVAIVQAALGVVVAFSTSYPEAGQLIVLKSVLDIALRMVTETRVEA